jgi:hypothetical protein
MATKEKMNSLKKTARIVGVLFITATVSSIIGTFGLLEPIVGAPDYLVNISANKNQMLMGIFVDSINSIAVVAIPVMLFSILKKHNETLALGYLVSRIFESVILIVGHISQLSLVTLSQGYVQAAAPDASYFQTLGTLLQGVYDWTFYLGPGIAFAITALILNQILYQSKLVPRWLSGWGLIGATMLFAYDVLQIWGFNLPLIVALPIALQEMVFAVWLIVKGFNSSAIASGCAKTELN